MRTDPDVFLNTIYLGDRACKSILIDSWKEEIQIHINLISRLRDMGSILDIDAAEDIIDGRIVLTGVRSIKFDPAGPVPNDFISDVEVERNNADAWTFRFFIDSVGTDSKTTNIMLEVVAVDIHLEDPIRPGVVIRV